jgi:hypothetical protein
MNAMAPLAAAVLPGERGASAHFASIVPNPAAFRGILAPRCRSPGG